MNQNFKNDLKKHGSKADGAKIIQRRGTINLRDGNDQSLHKFGINHTCIENTINQRPNIVTNLRCYV